MKALKSTKGREFEIATNKTRRTFTIKVLGYKYRTAPMDEEEFEKAKHWDADDWHYFIMNNNDYSEVK